MRCDMGLLERWGLSERYHYETHDRMRQHLGQLVTDHHFVRRLKTLKGLIPHEFICKAWQTEPSRHSTQFIKCRD